MLIFKQHPLGDRAIDHLELGSMISIGFCEAILTSIDQAHISKFGPQTMLRPMLHHGPDIRGAEIHRPNDHLGNRATDTRSLSVSRWRDQTLRFIDDKNER